MAEPVDTDLVRIGLEQGVPDDPGHLIDLAYALCAAIDRAREERDAARQLHANLLAHLRMEDGR